MTTAFQLNAFQPNAFQVATITGVLYAIDQNDSGAFFGTVTGGESNVDMHDGVSLKEIKQLEKIRKKLAKLREQEERDFAEKNEKRRKALVDTINPPVIAQVKKDEVELSQAIKVPQVNSFNLSAEIARIDLQRQLLERQIAQKQALFAYQQYMKHLEDQIKAELEDEEALLMLL